jgi:ABC-type nitrate/sulfonate/bicarbonate transport system permease component
MRGLYTNTRSTSWSSFLVGLLTLMGVLILWELVSRMRVYNPYLFPPPTQIARTFFQMVKSGEWISDLRYSLFRYGIGIALGIILGILLGVLTGKVQVFRDSLGPLLNFLRSTPSVALIPLAIVWFGIGEQEKIFVVTWGATFPLWLNTHAGISEVEIEYVWAARSLGATGWRIYSEVYVPRALPFIIAGTRMGIATAFFALAAAEMAGAFGGVAFRIFHSHQMFRTDKMMVAILTIGLLGIICDRLFVRVMRWLLPWWVGGERVRNC